MVPTGIQETENRYLQRPLNSKMILGVLVQVCGMLGVLLAAKIAWRNEKLSLVGLHFSSLKFLDLSISAIIFFSSPMYL